MAGFPQMPPMPGIIFKTCLILLFIQKIFRLLNYFPSTVAQEAAEAASGRPRALTTRWASTEGVGIWALRAHKGARL